VRRLLLGVDVVLVALAIYLAVQVAHAWRAGGPVAPVEPPRPAAPEPAPVPSPPVARAGSAVGPIAEHNLFSPNRSEAPPEPPRLANQPVTPPPPRPRLYGIVMLADGQSRAFLEDVQRRRVFAYSVGDAVAGSRLERIEADRVVLSRGGESFEVLLRDPSKPKPKPPAPPATGAGPPGPVGPAAAPPPGVVPGAPSAGPAGEGSAGPGAPPIPGTPPRAGRLPLPGVRAPQPQPVPTPGAPRAAGPAAPGAAPGTPASPQADQDDDNP